MNKFPVVAPPQGFCIVRTMNGLRRVMTRPSEYNPRLFDAIDAETGEILLAGSAEFYRDNIIAFDIS